MSLFEEYNMYRRSRERGESLGYSTYARFCLSVSTNSGVKKMTLQYTATDQMRHHGIGTVAAPARVRLIRHLCIYTRLHPYNLNHYSSTRMHPFGGSPRCPRYVAHCHSATCSCGRSLTQIVNGGCPKTPDVRRPSMQPSRYEAYRYKITTSGC